MAIDKSKIRVGDQVKIEFTWFGIALTSDWVTIDNQLRIGNGIQLRDSVKIIDHKPNLKPLQDEVDNAKIVLEEAQSSLRDAEAALAVAKGDLKYAYGTRVRFTGSGSGYDQGTIVECPEDWKDINNKNLIWVRWDGFSTPKYVYGSGSIEVIS